VSPCARYDNPVVVQGAPDTVGDGVMVYSVASGDPAGSVQIILIAPLFKTRSVPISVADVITTGFGSKKSLAAAECLPTFFAIIYIPLSN
jgi:hypothetical protein